MSYVLNERTKRRIKVGSPTYKKALSNGDITETARRFRSRSASKSRSRSRSGRRTRVNRRSASRSKSRSRSRSGKRSPKTLKRTSPGTCRTRSHFYKQNKSGRRSPVPRDLVKNSSRTRRCSSKKLVSKSPKTRSLRKTTKSPRKITRSPRKTLKTRSPRKTRSLKKSKSLSKSKSAPKRTKTVMEELMNLPAPDENMGSEEFEPSIPGSFNAEALEPTFPGSFAAATVADSIPVYQISDVCPPEGTEGKVISQGEGYLFIYYDTASASERALFIVKERDATLKVFAKNPAYERAWRITQFIRNEKTDCYLYLKFLDSTLINAILVNKNNAVTYPQVDYPTPSTGWFRIILLTGSIALTIGAIAAGYQNPTALIGVWNSVREVISAVDFASLVKEAIVKAHDAGVLGVEQAQVIWTYLIDYIPGLAGRVSPLVFTAAGVYATNATIDYFGGNTNEAEQTIPEYR